MLAYAKGRVGLRKAIGLHQVGPDQELVGRIDPSEILSRAPRPLGQARPARYVYRIIPLLQQLGDGGDAPYDVPEAEVYAKALDVLHLPLHDLLRQPELRNAVHEHPPGHVKGLEQRDPMAQPGEVGGGGKPGGPGPDDGHPPARGRGAFRHTHAMLPLPVRQEALQATDVDRVAPLAPDAVHLALLLLRAHPAAHRGEGVLGLDEGYPLLIPPLDDAVDELGDGHLHRAPLLALRALALEAAPGLRHRHLLRVPEGDLLEVLDPLLGVLARHGDVLVQCPVVPPPGGLISGHRRTLPCAPRAWS